MKGHNTLGTKQLNSNGPPVAKISASASLRTYAIRASFLFKSEYPRTQKPLTNEHRHSHLLEKIRKMGEKATKKEQSHADGVPAPPQPVKRKLII